LRRVLGDVRASVEDWRAMRARVDDALADLRAGAAHLKPGDLEEAEAFLRWLADDHFTFLGYSACDLDTDEGGEVQLRHAAGASLGVVRDRGDGRSESFAALPASVRSRAREPEPALTIAKANARSTVHRAAYLDFVGVKRFAADGGGAVAGEHRFLGLFTSSAYSRNPRAIPLLRRKVGRVFERAGFPASGHAGKALAHILDTFPRDELFQADEDWLLATATEVLHIQDRQKLRLFLRADQFGRSVSCLVYVPRDRYNTAVRERMQRALEEELGGTAETEFQAQLTESTLARLLFTVRTPNGVPADLDADALERRLVELSQGWSDRLRGALLESCGEEEGNRLFAAFGRSMSAGYQEVVEPRLAASDIVELDRLSKRAEGSVSLGLYRRLEDAAELVRLKLIRRDRPVLLSDALPILENMGLKVLGEGSHEFHARDGGQFFLHDFELRPQAGGGRDAVAVDVDALRDSFARTFLAVWSDAAESDGFNRLVLAAGLGVREITVLRAYCKYLLQTGTPFSQAYIEQTLTSNPDLARGLAELFVARFDPSLSDEARAHQAERSEAAVLTGRDVVQSLDEDRII
ncbi:MAG TPA: hypothetical protein VF606_09180, partial [Geminicoccaceae bacterium]